MIDPARGVAAASGIDDFTVAQLEDERMLGIVRIAMRKLVDGFPRGPDPAILDDQRTLADRSRGKDSAAVDARVANDIGPLGRAPRRGRRCLWFPGAHRASNEWRMAGSPTGSS